MSDEVTKPFNMARPFKRPAEDRQTAEQMKREDYDWMVIDRDAWQAMATKATADLDAARAEVLRLTTERDAAETLAECNAELTVKVRDLVRQLLLTTAERDNWKQRAETLEQAAQRLTAENEGLRADALAYPPQRIDPKQYADLKADYDRQVIMIETLQEALKRTETLLAKAQAEHIDDRLKGFLSVISQLADQAQDLLP